MRSLYPAIQPYQTHWLAVDQTHTLYLEESGSIDGIPVIFLHGGPGAGCEPRHRCFFDPQRYRIVLFDQRGCARSTPHGELRDNTTPALVADMESIRCHLGIERWLLFGGSWGATLALAYAQAHPERTLGLILRGVFLARQRDLDWFYRDGASRVFPDAWADFLEPIPAAEREDLIGAYHRRLTGSNDLERMRMARAWSTWEGRLLSLGRGASNPPGLAPSGTDSHRSLSLARIEAHYFINRCFLSENQLLENLPTIAHLPATIIQGRYDVITPVDGAWALAEAWPNADLRIVAPAGHAATEALIVDGLVGATMRFAHQFTPQ